MWHTHARISHIIMVLCAIRYGVKCLWALISHVDLSNLLPPYPIEVLIKTVHLPNHCASMCSCLCMIYVMLHWSISLENDLPTIVVFLLNLPTVFASLPNILSRTCLDSKQVCNETRFLPQYSGNIDYQTIENKVTYLHNLDSLPNLQVGNQV